MKIIMISKKRTKKQLVKDYVRNALKLNDV